MIYTLIILCMTFSLNAVGRRNRREQEHLRALPRLAGVSRAVNDSNNMQIIEYVRRNSHQRPSEQEVKEMFIIAVNQNPARQELRRIPNKEDIINAQRREFISEHGSIPSDRELIQYINQLTLELTLDQIQWKASSFYTRYNRMPTRQQLRELIEHAHHTQNHIEQPDVEPEPQVNSIMVYQGEALQSPQVYDLDALD